MRPELSASAILNILIHRSCPMACSRWLSIVLTYERIVLRPHLRAVCLILREASLNRDGGLHLAQLLLELDERLPDLLVLVDDLLHALEVHPRPGCDDAAAGALGGGIRRATDRGQGPALGHYFTLRGSCCRLQYTRFDPVWVPERARGV
eukprot:992857-Prymnesium_polylepis.2